MPGARRGAKYMTRSVAANAPRSHSRWLPLVLLVAACSSSRSADDDQSTSALLGADGPIFGDDSEDPNRNVPGYFAGQACAGQVAGAEAAPTVLQLLVDTSGSMDENAPGARGSKWTVTRQAVQAAFETMPEDTSVGVIFYPNVPNNNTQPCIDR